jgi:hypothetical protein
VFKLFQELQMQRLTPRQNGSKAVLGLPGTTGNAFENAGLKILSGYKSILFFTSKVNAKSEDGGETVDKSFEFKH